MTKAQAQIEFARRKKIRHKYFMEQEFIFLNSENKMEDENGLILNKQDFWLLRCKGFDDGWSIVE